MRCLVTGGTGLVGSNLALKLVEDGHDVIITGHEAEQQLPEFHGKCLNPGFLGINWDAIGAVDVLYHQAALNNTRNMDRDEMFLANTESSKALFDYAIKNGCKKIVYATSTAVYGCNPAPYKEDGPFDLSTPYAESKMAMEEYATELAATHPDLTIVGLRYCNIYGPHESHKGPRATMIYQMAQQMLKGNPRLFKHGEQTRAYAYVKDVVRANLLAAEAAESCIVNCGYDGVTSFNRLVEILNEVLGLQRQPEYFDNPFEGNYQDNTQCDMSLAKEKLGYAPEYTVEEGIRDYYASGWLV
jgi:ADP-L-glycero-D-manno-heptose 6-epimerase